MHITSDGTRSGIGGGVEPVGEADRTRVLHGQCSGDGAVQGAEAAAVARRTQD